MRRQDLSDFGGFQQYIDSQRLSNFANMHIEMTDGQGFQLDANTYAVLMRSDVDVELRCDAAVDYAISSLQVPCRLYSRQDGYVIAGQLQNSLRYSSLSQEFQSLHSPYSLTLAEKQDGVFSSSADLPQTIQSTIDQTIATKNTAAEELYSRAWKLEANRLKGELVSCQRQKEDVNRKLMERQRLAMRLEALKGEQAVIQSDLNAGHARLALMTRSHRNPSHQGHQVPHRPAHRRNPSSQGVPVAAHRRNPSSQGVPAVEHGDIQQHDLIATQQLRFQEVQAQLNLKKHEIRTVTSALHTSMLYASIDTCLESANADIRRIENGLDSHKRHNQGLWSSNCGEVGERRVEVKKVYLRVSQLATEAYLRVLPDEDKKNIYDDAYWSQGKLIGKYLLALALVVLLGFMSTAFLAVNVANSQLFVGIAWAVTAVAAVYVCSRLFSAFTQIWDSASQQLQIGAQRSFNQCVADLQAAAPPRPSAPPPVSEAPPAYGC